MTDKHEQQRTNRTQNKTKLVKIFSRSKPVIPVHAEYLVLAVWAWRMPNFQKGKALEKVSS